MGSAPSAPANTTSTTTVNQSPWQNPTYQALMLGDSSNPGPVTSMLRASNALMKQYNTVNQQGLTPEAQAALGTWNPSTAASTANYVNRLNPATGQYEPTLNQAAPANAAAMNARLPASNPQTAQQQPVQQRAAEGGEMRKFAAGSTTGQAPYSLLDTLGRTAYFDPTTGQTTLPDFLQLQQTARNLQTPAQFAQGTQDVQAATQALLNRAGYTPQQIRAQRVGPSGYRATSMAAPQNIQAQGYDAAQAQTAQMATPQNIQALQTQSAQMTAPQMINPLMANVASTAGPTDWTTAAAQQYMNPYAETALAAQQRLANLNYAQQNNQLMSQAAGQKAFGGSRAQLSLALNKLNQDIANQNLAAQGMNTAYNTGLSAFQSQNQLQQQANLANQQAYNTAFNNFVAQGMSAQQANQAAQLQVAQQNATLQQQANLANQSAGMTAQQANQQAALASGQANLNAAQQTAMANQAAQNQAMQTYVQQALQAAQTSYGGQLTAAQQNQVAANAAAQFNAQNAQQAALANQQANLTAQTQNQQAGLQANQQNISALQGAAGSGAQLANIGTAQNQATLANLGALGQSAQAQQNLGQQYLNTQQQNAATWMGMPATINAPAANVINAQPATGGGSASQQTFNQASWADGGTVEKDSWASGKKKEKDSWAYVSKKGRK